MSQLPGYLPGVSSDTPSIRKRSRLDQHRNIICIGDLVRVPASLFRHPADMLQFPEGLLWLQKLIRREPAVRFSPDKVEHPITEHTEPDWDQVAGFGFDRGSLGSEVRSEERRVGKECRSR